MSHHYPSDISRDQFSKIKPILELSRKKRRPRQVDLYDVFCGVLYLLKSGCQWSMLPKDFPKWQRCYDYFKIWSEKTDDKSDSTLEVVLKKISWRGPKKQWSERENKLSDR
jgi:hypothetical protein